MSICDKALQLTVFDLDHTLLNVNSSFEFGRFLYKRRLFSLADMLYLITSYGRHKLLGLDLDTLHQKVFKRLFFGRPASFFTDQINPFLDLYFNEMLNPTAVAHLQQAQQNKHYTAILSNSPHILIGPIAERFQVDFWEGSQYALDHTDRFSSIAQLMKGKQKAEYLENLALRLGILPEQITVYTDSYLDLPMAEKAGHVVGVNPDRALRRLCEKRKWQVI